MEMLSGAQWWLGERWKIREREHVFGGYPGGSVLDMTFSSKTARWACPGAHEQAAVHMADGYAAPPAKVGTVLVTSGPGATNYITGIATAMDSIPW